MVHFRRFVSFSALAIVASGLVSAATITYNGSSNPGTVSIPDTTTNFSLNLFVPYFNPAVLCGSGDICTLNSVFISLTGDVLGNVKFESLDGAPTTVTTHSSATITLSRPGAGTTIVIALPDFLSSDQVTAYDGTIDFGGTSGITRTGVSNSDTKTATLTSAPDKALFTGSGLFSLPVSATGTSSATGAGNLITQFATKAGAAVSVTYDFTDVVVSTTPEPATFAMLGGALFSLGFWRRKR